MKKSEVKNNNEIRINSNALAIFISVFVVVFCIVYFGSHYFYFSSNELDYEVVNEVIYIDSDKGTLKVVDSYYNEKDSVYVIECDFINNGIKDYVEFEFLVYDDEDYVLGSASGGVSVSKSDNKYKIKASYYDSDATEIKRFKIAKIYGN